MSEVHVHDHEGARECETPVVPEHLVSNAKGEQRTRLVVVLTFVMMIAEVGLGWMYGSMALVADGWHMGSHVAALSITLFAYWHARHHKDNPRFSFGTGKVGALGGFASGATLAFVALMLVGECIERALHPEHIAFDQALIVAVVGLFANLLSAVLLGDGSLGPDAHGHGHGHGGADHGHGAHDHDHGHGHGHGDAHDHAEAAASARTKEDLHLHGHDHNLRAAYLHVLADALTSVLAIGALLVGKYFDLQILDPLVGLVACAVIVRWTVQLLRQSAVTLLDQDPDTSRTRQLREALEADGSTRVSDLHVWTVAPGVLASMITLESSTPRAIAEYRKLAQSYGPFTHLTVEVRPTRGMA